MNTRIISLAVAGSQKDNDTIATLVFNLPTEWQERALMLLDGYNPTGDIEHVLDHIPADNDNRCGYRPVDVNWLQDRVEYKYHDIDNVWVAEGNADIARQSKNRYNISCKWGWSKSEELTVRVSVVNDSESSDFCTIEEWLNK